MRRLLQYGLIFASLILVSVISQSVLTVRSARRSERNTVLVCELQPRPQNPSRFRFRWIAPSGRIIANGPVAIVENNVLEGQGGDGFVCESQDMITHEKMRTGFRAHSNIHAVQGYVTETANIIGEPSPPQMNAPLKLIAMLTPAPRNSQITYDWTKDGAPILQSRGRNIHVIPSLSTSDQGDYKCRIGWVNEYGTRQELTADFSISFSGSNIEEVFLVISSKHFKKNPSDAVTLDCKIEGTNDPGELVQQIQWFYAPKQTSPLSARIPISSRQGWRITSSPQASFISNDRLSREDDGFYFCRLDSMDSEESARIMISQFGIVTSTVPQRTVCTPYQIQCNGMNGGPTCATKCNGIPECRDNSDEAGCGVDCDPAIRTCLPNRQGRQPTKQTYNVNWECDGEDDCGNNYDEEFCDPHRDVAHCPFGATYGQTRSMTRYQCPQSNKTIPIAYLCDGTKDCDYNEDENRCQGSAGGISIDRTMQGNQSLSVFIGGNITMECSVSAFPPPRIIWRLQWKCLPEQQPGTSQTPYGDRDMVSRRVKVTSTVTNCEQGVPRVKSTLQIIGAVASDQGIYNCEALLGSKRAMSDDFKLDVRRPNYPQPPYPY